MLISSNQNEIKVIFERDSYESHKANVEKNRNYRQKSEYYLLKNSHHFEDYIPTKLILHHYTINLLLPEICLAGTKNNFHTILNRNVLKNFEFVKVKYKFIGYDYYLQKGKSRKKISYNLKCEGIPIEYSSLYQEALVKELKGPKFKKYLSRKQMLNNEIDYKLNNLEYNAENFITKI